MPYFFVLILNFVKIYTYTPDVILFFKIKLYRSFDEVDKKENMLQTNKPTIIPSNVKLHICYTKTYDF